MTNGTALDITHEIVKLEQRCEQLTQSIFADLKPMQVVQIARHPQRPNMLDYIEKYLQILMNCKAIVITEGGQRL